MSRQDLNGDRVTGDQTSVHISLTDVRVQIFRVDDLPIESGMLTDALDNAQKKVEAYFFNMRKQLWEYDQARTHSYSRKHAVYALHLQSPGCQPEMHGVCGAITLLTFMEHSVGGVVMLLCW